jgi:hypothetical protein
MFGAFALVGSTFYLADCLGALLFYEDAPRGHEEAPGASREGANTEVFIICRIHLCTRIKLIRALPNINYVISNILVKRLRAFYERALSFYSKKNKTLRAFSSHALQLPCFRQQGIQYTPFSFLPAVLRSEEWGKRCMSTKRAYALT